MPREATIACLLMVGSLSNSDKRPADVVLTGLFLFDHLFDHLFLIKKTPHLFEYK